MKTGPLRLNINTIAIIYKNKYEYIQNIAPIFFGIKTHNDEINDTFLEKHIIFKPPFVFFIPQDSIDQYKEKWFIFYYFIIINVIYNDDNIKIDYTEEEFNNMFI